MKRRIYSLQAGRAIAALLVVLFHVTGSSRDVFQTRFLGDFFRFGFGGVDFFFVLSGFIIAYTSWEAIGQSGAFFPYLSRRTIRIYPTYWLVVIPLIGIVALGLLPYQAGFQTSPGAIVSSLTLWFGHTRYDGVSWTLTYEVCFYLAFGLALLSSRVYVPLGIYLVLFLLRLGGIDSNVIQTLGAPINMEFIFGVGIAVWFLKNPLERPLPSPYVAAFALALGVVSYPLLGRLIAPVHEATWRVVLFGVPAALVVFGLVALEGGGRVRPAACLVILGDASYVLYLIHLPIIRVSTKVVARTVSLSPTLTTGFNLSLVASLCLLSVAIHRRLEKPLLLVLNRWAGTTRQAAR